MKAKKCFTRSIAIYYDKNMRKDIAYAHFQCVIVKKKIAEKKKISYPSLITKLVRKYHDLNH